MSFYLRTVWNLAMLASLAVLFFGGWFQISLAEHWTPAALPYGVNQRTSLWKLYSTVSLPVFVTLNTAPHR